MAARDALDVTELNNGLIDQKSDITKTTHNLTNKLNARRNTT